MADDQSISRNEEAAPFKVGTVTVPLDLMTNGPEGDTWFRVPSARVEFDCEALKGFDFRVHRGLGWKAVWTLTEATTGFKVFGDLAHEFYIGDPDAMLAEFAAGRMKQLTREKVEKALEQAREILTKLKPNPFVVSETRPRPMATAPKDEHGLLAYSPSFYQGKGGWVAAVWRDNDWWSNPGGWRFEPTHWLPFPEKP